jgi:putative endonuclease
MPRPGFWWIYVLERADGSWYTGISTDPRRRLAQHKSGRGARANKISAPQRLVCLEPGGDYARALRRETQVKRLSKKKKRLYAADPSSLPWPAENAPWLNKKRRQKNKPPSRRKRIMAFEERKTVSES